MFSHFFLAAMVAAVQGTGVITPLDSTANSHQASKAPGQVIRHGKLVYSEITIAATPEKVWSILTHFEDYPNWNPFIKTISGTPVVGGNISAQIQPPNGKAMQFTPRVLQFTENKELRWIGKVMVPFAFDGEHTFSITDNGNGTVTFKQYEHFRGVLVPFFKKMLEVDTKAGFEMMNGKLKELAEQTR